MDRVPSGLFLMTCFLSIYERLLEVLALYQQTCCNEKRMIELSFQACFTHYRQLEEEISKKEWTDAEWITFNKFFRSLFLAKIEYYILRYHAALFCPVEEEPAMHFWTLESLRLDSFRQEHKEFYHYCISGREEQDVEYYSCTSIDPMQKLWGTILRAKLLAVKEYMPYVQKQLRFFQGAKCSDQNQHKKKGRE